METVHNILWFAAGQHAARRRTTLSMALPSVSLDRPSPRALLSSADLASPARTAFDLVCEVEKWPVWLSFIRTARRVAADAPLTLGSEVAIRSDSLGEGEELFEVERFIPGHQLSLVGAYSIRRRIDIRIESKTEHCKVVVRIDYPTYGGILGKLIDRLTRRRHLSLALGESMIHFKWLCEYNRDPQAILADF